MAKEYIESKCGSCSHSDACVAWIRHCSTLYGDFSYSVEDCPYYLPAADVVEVVRCKSCKHRAVVIEGGNYLCNRKILGVVRPMDFCSFGERRENDG